jgi:hypothetical protein
MIKKFADETNIQTLETREERGKARPDNKN